MSGRASVWRRFLATVALIGTAAPFSVVAAPVARAADTVVSSVNFNDSTTGDWTQSGGPTLSYVDDGSGGMALSITRAADYEGIQSPTGLLAEGITYTFSMRAKLADGTADSAGIRFVVKPAYSWVGNTTIDASGWTTVTGTYDLPAGTDPAAVQIYIGTADQTGPYTVLVDDILITAPTPVTTVDSVNFNDSTTGDWTQSGGPTLSYVDDGSGGMALSITRAADYEGIQSPTGLLAEGITYTFSMRAKLADGTADSAGIRFVVKPAYSWVGNTTIDASGWTTVTGTYDLPAGTDPAAVQIYIGTADQTGPYTVLVDDILITAPGSTGGGTGVLDSDCSNGYVGLTFDDGPYAGQTNLLLTALEAAHLRATFFDWGQHIAGNGSLVLAQAANGWVGNHTWDHTDLTTLTEAQITTELTDTQDAITGAGVAAPVLMRPPYGSSNATVKAVEASLGLTEILWDVDSQDWNGATTPQIVAAVRSATNGQVVLMHDNLATTRAAIPLIADAFTATKKCPGMINPATGKAVAPPSQVQINTDFENGMDGWVARNSQGTPTVDLTTDEAHSPTHAALVSNRTGQGDGIGHDVTGLMKEGTQYLITAWVKFAPGNATDSMSLSMRRTTGTTDTYDTVSAIADVTSTAWKKVSVKYTMGPAESAFLYFETTYASGANGNANPFLVDDIQVEVFVPSGFDPDLPGLMTTVPFPLGVAVSSADTTGNPSALLLHHFNQVTPENSMKVEAWYDADKNFRMNPEAKSILDYAVANNLRVYGHTLVWHSQTPDWFFMAADGVTPLTSSDADKAFFRTRLQTHINNVAKAISDQYGLFGSSTNPVVAFDVVNEVISDGTTDPGGLRQSRYYQILGEEYIEDAFNWADQAFNDTYAAPAATRPVKLTINDYNTDSSGKRQRLHDLVALLLSHDVPVDLVGHQFHISLTTPVQNLDDALAAFEDLPVKQVVSELDVSITDAVDDAKLIEQGYVYRDAFRIFRARATDLFCVTVWGLYDTVSWRAAQYPLIFSDSLAAKPAYRGAADSPTLEPRLRTANVFQADVPLDSGATTSMEWKKLPLIVFGTGDKVSFQSRWMPDHLSVYVAVKDATVDATDGLTFKVADQTCTVARGQTDATAVTTEVAGGWLAVVHLPLSNAQAKDKVQLDVADTDGTTVTGWNDAGATGTLTLVEPLSFVHIAPTDVAPTIDGVEDPGVWSLSNPEIQTLKQVTGTDTAIGSAKLLYKGNVLYVFMHVVDPVLDNANSNPWEKDSVEIYVDNTNAKSSGYRVDDMQIRINYSNEVSFGSGDTEANQRARLTSATQIVSDGYVVEAAISLLGGGGVNSYIGLDVQVNDAQGGARVGIRNWADPTNAGYLSPSHWGVGRLDPEMDHLVVSPAVATIAPGASQAYTAVGYDSSGNSLGDVTSATTFVIDSSTSCPAHSCSATTAGDHIVTGTVGSAHGTATLHVDAGAATQLSVSGLTSPLMAGAAGTVTVTALDAFSNTATGYAGTVHFTSSDGSAVLPADSTLTAGVGSFSVTLKTAGTQSVTATDTVTASITGAQSGIVVNPAAATTLVVSGFPSPDVAGVAHTVTVTARDQYGNTATGYTGKVHFTSDDSAAVLPANATLTAGVGTFSVTLKTVGTRSITATDTVTPSISGAQSGIVVDPSTSATSLVVSGFPSPDLAGVAHTITVTAKDQFGNTATGYKGTVHFTSNDGAAVLPANATLTAGVGTFSVTLKTAGTRTITATDTVTASLKGSQNGIVVNPAALSKLVVAGLTSPRTAGSTGSIRVTATDAYGNRITGYRGTIHFTSTDPSAKLPANYKFTATDAGTHLFYANVTLKTAGTRTITATDTVTASLKGSQNGIVVNPAALSKLVVAGLTSPRTAGSTGSIRVTATDAYGNRITGYRGTIHFTSTDPSAKLPANYKFTATDAGTHLFFANVILKTKGTWSVTATDTVTAKVKGSQTGIVVNPAALSKLVVAGLTSPRTAGSTGSIRVTATDAYGNRITGYTGTIHFGSSDKRAWLPANYKFTATDAGTHLFFANVILKTKGTWSVSATDTVNTKIKGSQTGIVVR